MTNINHKAKSLSQFPGHWRPLQRRILSEIAKEGPKTQLFLPAQRKLMRFISSFLHIILALIICIFTNGFQGQLLLPKDPIIFF